MSDIRLHPQRERDIRFCLGVLRPEGRRLLADMEYATKRPWLWLRWFRTYRRVVEIHELWRQILDGEQHASRPLRLAPYDQEAP